MPKILRSERRTERHDQVVPARVQALIFVYTLAAAGLATYVIISVPRVHVGRSLPWPLIAAVLVLADFMAMKFHTDSRHSVTVELMGVPVAVGAVFSAPTGLMAAVALAMGAVWIKGGEHWERPTFNVVNQIVGVCLSYLVIISVLGRSEPVHFRGVAAICLGILCYQTSTMLGMFAARAAASGWPDGKYVRALAIEVGTIFPFNAIVGVITVSIAVQEVWGILLLVGPGIILAFWYRASTMVRSRYADLQLLYGFTVKLAGLTDTDEIIDTALGEARALLSCQQAQLTLPAGSRAVRCVVGPDGRARRLPAEYTALETRVMTREAPLVIHNRTTRITDMEPYDDLMAIPIQLGELGMGSLIVAGHTGEGGTFDGEHVGLFEALAAHLSTALTSSQRLDRLQTEMEAREHQALHDGLTGLANRILFARWVSDALAVRVDGEMVGVMLMDLDGFKDINDTLGHHAGDVLLKEIASRLSSSSAGRWSRTTDARCLAARLGGDEFAFVLPSVGDAREAFSAAQAILASVSRPIYLDGLVLELRASVGVALAPQDGVDAAALLQRADVAMYAAKGSKRGVVAYDGEIDRHTKRRLTLASELRKAMDANELEVWYQPVAHTDTGELAGFEALLRWFPDFGQVPPSEFIPVAEQSGLIEPLTWWVVEEALTELKGWLDRGIRTTMAVNVSARCLQNPDMVGRLGRILDDIGVPAQYLTLEITETLLMNDPEWSAVILERLTDLGLRIAVDDFGTGYSSLSRLKRLPVHTVKIDRSFVMSMHDDEGDEAIVRATLDLARAMGHAVVAEGVERQDTWDSLADLGCDFIQGYALSPAMPSSDCRSWYAGAYRAANRFHRSARGA